MFLKNSNDNGLANQSCQRPRDFLFNEGVAETNADSLYRQC